ncbi:MAG: mitochondrial fission ELM1 family protein [Alphaproteobacteria bacterium]|nr:mitochondrial fission ELM1 family protein [Alphaproteobacteria bacterium]
MRAWGVTDGSAGMVAQVRALAEALGVALEEKTITVNAPWRWLPNVAFDLGLANIFPVTNETYEDPPELIISCGRKGALVSAYSRLTTHDSRLIHIQDPQMSAKHFDVVVAMEHDKIAASNVIKVPYALHSITAEKLSEAKALWEPKFAHIPRPWNVVLIGGSTNKYHFTRKAMQKLISDVEQISGGMIITTSRRTGADNIALLLAHLGKNKAAYIYTGEGENPYLGMLACADKIYVTNDSVNMMSEALAAGKPVSILKLWGHANTKPARFAESLPCVMPQEMMKNLVVSIRQMFPALT